jgi:Nitrate and nitrite sensing/Histidine kinase-, DNA gyrase B-, and HSP90-like ATPase
MASRQQSIKAKIILLLVMPLAALLVLWLFAASGSFGDTVLLVKAKSVDTKLIRPTQTLVEELEQERRLSIEVLGVGHEADRSALTSQRSQTDAARTAFQQDVTDGGLRSGLSSDLTRQMDGLSGRLGELDALRGAVDITGITRSTVFNEFNSLIDAAFAMYKAVSTSNAQIAQEVRILTALSRAREMLSREDALVTGALASHRITPAERDEIAELVGSQRFEYGETVPELTPADRDRFRAFLGSAEFQRFRGLEDSLVHVGRNGRPTVKVATWDAVVPEVLTKLRGLEAVAIDGTTERARSIAVSVLVRLALTGGLGLVALIASLVIAVRVARKVIGEVRTLSEVVEVFASERLPELAERVRQGEVIEEEDTSLEVAFSVTEIDRLSAAFDDSRRAVVAAARGEVAARKGVNEVFVNLARRNQALVHRQLGLLDTMERRVEDPQELDELFRLDHLATCMRRHAEGLVILAGRTAGRIWRTPVPLIDVVRGAVAEVEDYTRVQVLPMTRAALTGTAVADTIHLLAALIENAAMFSPPQAPVQVTGHPVPNGFVVEIEDRGLGMNADLLADLNARLAEAPEFDLFDSARLGIFVVARLAHRHDIRVSLSPSPYGGTTAIVLIPGVLIVGDGLAVPPPVAEVSGGAEDRRSISLAPEPVEVIDAANSTVPSFIVDAARMSGDGTTPDHSSEQAALPDRGPGDHEPTDRRFADGRFADGRFADSRFADDTSVAGTPVAGTPLAGTPLAGTPLSRTPADRVPQEPGTDAGTHLGMPRRRRKVAQVPPAADLPAEPAEIGAVPSESAGIGAGPSEPSGIGAGTDAPGTHLGMPRRRRQANLAPQLRGDSRESMEDEVTNHPGSDRTPDEVRARMTAMQSGWRRGRTVAETTTDPVADQTAGRSAEVPVGPAVRPAKEEDTP